MTLLETSLIWFGLTYVANPLLPKQNEQLGTSALVDDLGIRGVWQPQAMALLDIRVVDTDASSYVARPVESILDSTEQEKRRKYGAA